jgi:ERCC4-related helicase
VGILRRQLEQVDEEFTVDAVYKEATEDAIASSTRLFGAPNPEEQRLLDAMQGWADTASRQPDSKAQELLDWINTEIRPQGQWTDQRVIIFTEYRATQKSMSLT